MKPMVCALLGLVLAAPQALLADPESPYSFSEGQGSFYALRHHKPGGPPCIEVIGSRISMNRAKRQAAEGGYPLDIKGPFPGQREALSFIRENWERTYGAPKKALYCTSPQPRGTEAPPR